MFPWRREGDALGDGAVVGGGVRELFLQGEPFPEGSDVEFAAKNFDVGTLSR